MSIRACGIALACLACAACAGVSNQERVVPQSVAQLSSAPHIGRITVVIMENYDYEEIIGNASAEYTNALANANALYTNSHAITHPSEPNYIALFSGSTQGVTSDTCPLTFSSANVASELMAHGYTFQGYAENWPASGNPCYGTASSVSSHYLYWRKHAPWTDFTNVAYRTYGHAYVPGTALSGDVNFVIPNICNDQHDCSIATGDAWLARNIPAIQSYDNAHNGLLLVTYDEGEYSSSNHVVTIASGPMVTSGRYTQAVNHYSVLRLIESNFGLPLLGASASAAVMPGIGVTAPASAPPATDSFVRAGSVGGLNPTYLTVQYGSGCGWMHTYVNASTVYSPATWRPALGDALTVYGSGSCATGSVTASKIVKS